MQLLDLGLDPFRIFDINAHFLGFVGPGSGTFGGTDPLTDFPLLGGNTPGNFLCLLHGRVIEAKHIAALGRLPLNGLHGLNRLHGAHGHINRPAIVDLVDTECLELLVARRGVGYCGGLLIGKLASLVIPEEEFSRIACDVEALLAFSESECAF